MAKGFVASSAIPSGSIVAPPEAVEPESGDVSADRPSPVANTPTRPFDVVGRPPSDPGEPARGPVVTGSTGPAVVDGSTDFDPDATVAASATAAASAAAAASALSDRLLRPPGRVPFTEPSGAGVPVVSSSSAMSRYYGVTEAPGTPARNRPVAAEPTRLSGLGRTGPARGSAGRSRSRNGSVASAGRRRGSNPSGRRRRERGSPPGGRRPRSPSRRRSGTAPSSRVQRARAALRLPRPRAGVAGASRHQCSLVDRGELMAGRARGPRGLGHPEPPRGGALPARHDRQRDRLVTARCRRSASAAAGLVGERHVAQRDERLAAEDPREVLAGRRAGRPRPPARACPRRRSGRPGSRRPGRGR